MADFDDILTLIGQAADGLGAVGVPGAGLAGTVIRGAQGLADAFDNLKAANGGRAPAAAQEARDKRLAEVLRHADSTASRLEG